MILEILYYLLDTTWSNWYTILVIVLLPGSILLVYNYVSIKSSSLQSTGTNAQYGWRFFVDRIINLVQGYIQLPSRVRL
jgi:hypothetical protein